MKLISLNFIYIIKRSSTKLADAVISATSAETKTWMFSDGIKTTKCPAQNRSRFLVLTALLNGRSRSKKKISGRPYFVF